MRHSELALSALAAYSELFEQAHTLELGNCLTRLTGGFHKVVRKGREYWYFESALTIPPGS